MNAAEEGWLVVVEVDAVVVMVVRARGHPHLAVIRGLAIHVHDAHLRAVLVMAVVGALLGAVGPVMVVAVVLELLHLNERHAQRLAEGIRDLDRLLAETTAAAAVAWAARVLGAHLAVLDSEVRHEHRGVLGGGPAHTDVLGHVRGGVGDDDNAEGACAGLLDCLIGCRSVRVCG